MGVVKDYKRVELSAVLGLVGTGPRILYLKAGGREAHLVAVGANERVIIWDLRMKEPVQQLLGPSVTVTAMARSPDHKTLAVGYRDGSVLIFDVNTAECEVTFHGHKRAVTALAFDDAGMRLVSGSQDTDLTVWDLVSESGLFRLKGHTGEITQTEFMKGHNILVSSSKDKLVKFWDLDIQHCFKTLVGHRTEIYSFVLLNEGHRLVTGSADSELRVWDIVFNDEVDETDRTQPAKKARQDDSNDDEEDEDDDESSHLICVSRGSVMREARDQVRSILVDTLEKHLLCHGPGKKCEVFALASEEELQKKLKKRRKKARLRAVESGMEENIPEPTLTIEDEVRRVDSFKVSAKLRGLDFVATDGSLQVATLLSNNSVQTMEVQLVDTHNISSQDASVIHRNGHRSEVRTLAFSSDGSIFLSASGEQVKLWNRSSLQCISTLDCDYALCSTFAPGDKHVIIGTKTGKLQIFDLASRTMTSCISEHDDSIWSLSLAPKDKNGIVTGSKDQTVKFWNFELVASPEDEGRKHLTLVHKRTLKMDDQITCVTYSPDQRLLAVALLDNTVKVFFVDTLKLFHTLYGGSSPVLCMDISTDCTIIATGAADKNVKLWGLDFGDLKKSLFAHDDSVSCVKFIPKTHLFFSGGKDRLVKQWDADSFQHIITLKGHHAEVRALAVSPDGHFLVSSSHDMSLRLWEQTDSILVLDEEREQEREREEEEAINQGDEPVVAGDAATEVMAGRRTVDTVKGAESLIEAIDIYEEENQKLAEHATRCKTQGKQLPPPSTHPLMQAYKAESPEEFILIMLQKIRSSEIEETLLVLPFDYATKLLKILALLLKNNWETELSVRCVCFLLRIHQGQITSNQILLPTINSLRDLTMDRVKEFKDTVGYNLYAMQLLKIKLEEQREDKLFADATARFKQKKKKRKVFAPVVS